MSSIPNRLTIRRPDDWHVHLRDGAVLAGVLPYTARQFARAIVMPNLSPPMIDRAGVAAYRERIVAAAGPGFSSMCSSQRCGPHVSSPISARPACCSTVAMRGCSRRRFEMR